MLLQQGVEVRVEATRYLDLSVDTEQGEERVHVNQGLSGLSVHCAQEIEGKGELEEQAVDHHQVSHGHRSCNTTTETLSATQLTLSVVPQENNND